MNLRHLKVPKDRDRIAVKDLPDFKLSARGRNKFGAQATVVDGIRFDSRLEARRWGDLQVLARQGLITSLERQVSFALEVNGQLIARYIADFTYLEGGALVVEDAKGHRTPEYRLKAKLMKAIHGIIILETGTKSAKGRN